MDRLPATKRRKALTEIERHRESARVSIREAARRAGVADGTWRQLVAGQVVLNGRVVKREARRDQLLVMAAAVEALEEVTAIVGASSKESDAAAKVVVIPDPAEEHIMGSRHLDLDEKVLLVKTLQAYRAGLVDKQGRVEG